MMIVSPLYHAPNMTDWQGRNDATNHAYFYQIIQALDLRNTQEWPNEGIALLGFACDIGVTRNQGRAGAATAPQQIKQLLARLPIQKSIMLYDAGCIYPQDNDLLSAQAALGECVKQLLDKGLFPIVLGGGHETAWGHYQGIAKFFDNSMTVDEKKQNLHIVNFDAHFDLRELPPDGIGTSGTPFRQIALHRQSLNLPFQYECIGIQSLSNTHHLFTVAKTLNVNYLSADRIHQHGHEEVNTFLSPLLKTSAPIYLSLCMDVFAACYAPAVSAPQALGVSPWHLLPAIRKLAASGQLISFDIVELAPAFDHDGRTAKLSASLLSDFLHHVL
jgi:formiminoglutamase